MKEIKFRFVVEEKHPPRWEKVITMYYFSLDELLRKDYDRKGMPTHFTPPEYYFEKHSHGGKCLVGKNEYTGLHDKNGKEIYEGDILAVYLRDYGRNDVVQVYWDSETAQFNFGRSGVEGFEFYELVESENEIIGDIYENPELLEAK